MSVGFPDLHPALRREDRIDAGSLWCLVLDRSEAERVCVTHLITHHNAFRGIPPLLRLRTTAAR
jgi:hypothetical protein